ncbi:transglutaminase-like domain-containing protein [Luteimicrobium subarcticum]|uniref:Transglutaminase superfamily protein n=1 Tax=Luteimicrobium subarcticum TaxID=620910 RepID=A0A2M8WJ39_9MICO|nr:transglutaminase family protein [Luteimicrobium subarcticum]PJI90947.1 transglutaminase superfamily protein [Luteimicrobium subarcticum]
MQRDVTAHLTLDVTTPATLALAVAVSDGYGVGPGPGRATGVAGSSYENLTVTRDGEPVTVEEVQDENGTLLHVVRAQPGRLVVDYAAHLDGRHPDPVTPAPTTGQRLRFLRPSRYCESDSLAPTAAAEFAGLSGVDLLAGVSSWVGTRLSYVPGSSLPTDGAVRTLLARQGVCRDFAHLVVALLRALDVPARLVSVYAPGLDPMDFHAVAEAYVDGGWHVVDATTLAPRSSLIRIATGADASDTAFLSVYGGRATLAELEVTAVVDDLPSDDVRELVRLG